MCEYHVPITLGLYLLLQDTVQVTVAVSESLLW